MTAVSVFLLPNATFFVELLVVVVIVVVTSKYILPRFNKFLESRQELIRASLEAAEEARVAAAATDDERVHVLAEAREQAREITAAAQALADQVKAEAGGRGEAEYQRIVASAQAEIATARQRAIDDASARIGEIVFELVSQIVGREVDQSTHEDLLREAVAALNAEAQKGAAS
ncbi:MAG TPA: F0F1 ATP synthase subunit B [Acidimicrobiales bacterium]|nr:F0F1 ATP synthase subunit B [Acidimicrobiales bacterium]